MVQDPRLPSNEGKWLNRDNRHMSHKIFLRHYTILSSKNQGIDFTGVCGVILESLAFFKVSVNSCGTEFIFILFRNCFSLSSFLPSYLICQSGYHWYTSGIQMVDTLNCRETIYFVFVNCRSVAIVAEIVVLFPVRDDYYAGIEWNDKTLCEENLEIVLARPSHPKYLAWRDEAIIVCQHPQVEVKRLRGERHFQEVVGGDDLGTKHSALRHMSFANRTTRSCWQTRRLTS